MRRQAVRDTILLFVTGLISQVAAVSSNGATRHVALEEIWHQGGYDEKVILGNISQVRGLPNGVVYCLDRQLSLVHVFDPSGSYLGTLSQRGEGPGETIDSEDLILFPNNDLGIVCRSLNKVARVSSDGSFVEDIRVPIADAESGGLNFLRAARAFDDRIYFGGEHITLNDETGLMEEYMIACLDSHRQSWRMCFSDTVSNMAYAERVYRESSEFPRHFLASLWTIDSRGTLYFAPHRHEYTIYRSTCDGARNMFVSKPIEPCPRSEAVVAARRESLERHFHSLEGMKLELEAAAPAILSLDILSDGLMWVLDRCSLSQHGDTMRWAWDVYDMSGSLQEQFVVECEGNIHFDQLTVLPGERIVRVRNSALAARRYLGELDENQVGARAETTEITCFRIVN